MPIWPIFDTQCHLWAKSRFRTCCTCNNLKNLSFCIMFEKNCKSQFKKKKIWDTLYQTSVKCLQGIILCKFWPKILIQLQGIANCDHCTTPLKLDIHVVYTTYVDACVTRTRTCLRAKKIRMIILSVIILIDRQPL